MQNACFVKGCNQIRQQSLQGKTARHLRPAPRHALLLLQRWSAAYKNIFLRIGSSVAITHGWLPCKGAKLSAKTHLRHQMFEMCATG